MKEARSGATRGHGRRPCVPGCVARELFNATCDLPVGTENFKLELQGIFMRLAVTNTSGVCFHVDTGSVELREAHGPLQFRACRVFVERGWRKRRSSLKYLNECVIACASLSFCVPNCPRRNDVLKTLDSKHACYTDDAHAFLIMTLSFLLHSTACI